MRKNNYNTLAPIYEQLSRVVYGNALIKAQRSVLKMIKNGDKILLIGGGTGWILEEINSCRKKNIHVTYVEASSKMIALSKRRKLDYPVEFVCQYAENFISEKKYDVIIAPFFFDNFQENKCVFLLDRIDAFLKPKGYFLYVDFRITKENSKLWKKILLKTMYFFFSICTHIETDTLVDMDRILVGRYQKEWFQYSFHKFVFSAAYRKIV